MIIESLIIILKSHIRRGKGKGWNFAIRNYLSKVHIWGMLFRQIIRKKAQTVDKWLKTVEKLPSLWTIIRKTRYVGKKVPPIYGGVYYTNPIYRKWLITTKRYAKSYSKSIHKEVNLLKA
jgi:hypothetical protein